MFARADVVTLELAIKSGAADAEHLAGADFVALDLGKDAGDGSALDIFQVSRRGCSKLLGIEGLGSFMEIGLSDRWRQIGRASCRERVCSVV